MNQFSPLPNLCPQDPLPGLPLEAYLEQVIPCLRPARAPPVLSGGSALRPAQVLPDEGVTCLQLIKLIGQASWSYPLPPRLAAVWLAARTFGRLGLPAQRLASAHFFSEISRVRCARDLGSGIVRASVRYEYPIYVDSHSTRSSSASLAHSSAFSFPRTSPLFARR